MKRIITLLLVVIIMTLSGCSGGTGKDKTTTLPAEETSYARMKKTGELLLGMDTSELPWVQLNTETGEYEGFEYELWTLIAREMGIKLKIISSHWVNLGNALLEKKFDVVASAYSENDVEEPENYIFGVPYYSWYWVGCARKDDRSINTPADLKGKIVGCYIDSQDLCKTIEGIKELKVYDEPAYDMLLEKEIDVFIYDSTSVYYTVQSEPGLKTVGRIFPDSNVYQFIYRKEDTELASAIDTVLKKILASDEYKSILKKWIPAADET